ncbi:MAG: RagB/SusD family nutrient uptake outer membrane protein [Cyclobacteriaceae bacterium]|nr:RagB/SusD family nutrient uptake outer membrane protein [Cyclobacteriaceae bacterium]
MKKSKYIVLTIIVVLLGSCKDKFLDAPTKSALDDSVIFSSVDLARGAVDGIKVSFGETNSYRGRLLPYYGTNTDIEWYNASENTGDKSDLAVYDAKTINGEMNTTNNAWAMMYQGIERANLCISGIRTYGDPQPGNEMGYLLGEALTLRTIYYADLLKTWGDVPARFEPLTTETIYVPKASRDVIYKQLIADLEEAATLVPWPNESGLTATVENINKAFVKGLRARLCLAASGYSQYPDGVRRSTDPDLSVANMYPIALQECLDVINSGTVHLESSFETLWRSYNEEVLAAGGESLWEIPFSEGRGRMLFTFAVRHDNNDQYQQNGNSRGGASGPLPNVFYDYDVKDLRRDVSCVPYKYGPVDLSGIARQELVGLDTWYFGKYRYEWMTRLVTSTNDDGINKMYMRYAEVLLMAAEIENELNGPSAAAPYLTQIRQRAFDPADWSTKVDAYIAALGSKEEMFNAIVKEHGFEFVGEMERKQALIRWNLLKTKIDEAKTKLYALRDRTGEYADVPAAVYYKYDTDGESLVIYGLNRGETTDPGAGFTSVTYVAPEELEDTKIESIYTNDPNTKQYWPIWQVFLDASNGTLINDYGY